MAACTAFDDDKASIESVASLTSTSALPLPHHPSSTHSDSSTASPPKSPCSSVAAVGPSSTTTDKTSTPDLKQRGIAPTVTLFSASFADPLGVGRDGLTGKGGGGGGVGAVQLKEGGGGVSGKGKGDGDSDDGSDVAEDGVLLVFEMLPKHPFNRASIWHRHHDTEGWPKPAEGGCTIPKTTITNIPNTNIPKTNTPISTAKKRVDGGFPATSPTRGGGGLFRHAFSQLSKNNTTTGTHTPPTPITTIIRNDSLSASKGAAQTGAGASVRPAPRRADDILAVLARAMQEKGEGEGQGVMTRAQAVVGSAGVRMAGAAAARGGGGTGTLPSAGGAGACAGGVGVEPYHAGMYGEATGTGVKGQEWGHFRKAVGRGLRPAGCRVVSPLQPMGSFHAGRPIPFSQAPPNRNEYANRSGCAFLQPGSTKPHCSSGPFF
ncbi:unnamed protein product [Vitrella brassicaformis CCMP3155]|uniref:Uncharacterized protein n=1 Tax=Vitrella brassicaformis (strain CCMP3155) TaxID=1169540 RepID=A0A0G4EXA9_VITBC|nr:unnamed protein product [Vitrella brassicaformis CCMP3155]|eukprot:CEM03204.1 unnamed protein product [Vitrella brassicaformis CCMP3155]